MVGHPLWDQEARPRALGGMTPTWVRLRGYVTDEELADLYRNAAACMFPSLHEGFGPAGPRSDGVRHAASVLANSGPGRGRGDAAAYFDPLVIEDMTRVMSSLLNDLNRSSELASRAFIRAREFTWSSSARKTIRSVPVSCCPDSPRVQLHHKTS